MRGNYYTSLGLFYSALILTILFTIHASRAFANGDGGPNSNGSSPGANSQTTNGRGTQSRALRQMIRRWRSGGMQHLLSTHGGPSVPYGHFGDNIPRTLHNDIVLGRSPSLPPIPTRAELRGLDNTRLETQYQGYRRLWSSARRRAVEQMMMLPDGFETVRQWSHTRLRYVPDRHRSHIMPMIGLINHETRYRNILLQYRQEMTSRGMYVPGPVIEVHTPSATNATTSGVNPTATRTGTGRSVSTNRQLPWYRRLAGWIGRLGRRFRRGGRTYEPYNTFDNDETEITFHKPAFNVYPNMVAVGDYINIELVQQPIVDKRITIQLFSTGGNVVFPLKDYVVKDTQPVVFEVPQLTPGVYLLCLSDYNKMIGSHKIIIK